MLDCVYVFDVMFIEGGVKDNLPAVQLDINSASPSFGEGLTQMTFDAPWAFRSFAISFWKKDEFSSERLVF